MIVSAAAVLGSADRLLGRLAHACGDLERAAAHFERALRLEQDAGAHACLARTLHDFSLLLVERGSAGDLARASRAFADATRLAAERGMRRLAEQTLRTAAAHVATPAARATDDPDRETRDAPRERTPSSMGSTFRLEGEYWTLAFDGRVARVRHLRGLSYLAVLLASPHRAIPALDLVTAAEPDEDRTYMHAPLDHGELSVGGDAGELLDPEARRAYARRLRELDEELEDAARRDADLGRTERLHIESEMLRRELSRAFSLSGRARVSVTRALRKAISQVERAHGPLGAHLRRAIRTGRTCSYEPTRESAPDWCP